MIKTVSKLSEHVLDKRIVQRNITKKLLTEEEYKAYLSQLKNESDHCEPVHIDEDETTSE